MGALTPIGHSVSDFWNSAMKGESGAAEIKSFDASAFKTRIACELKEFITADHFDRKELKKYDLFTQYALYTVREAIKEANIGDEVDRERVGVIWGSGNGGIQTFEEQLEDYNNQKDLPRFSPFFIPRILADIAAGVISMEYGFKGINFCPISACATSTTALIEAFNYIKWDKADIIVSGGSEAPICASTIGGFGSLKALSTCNESPTTASRPFDINRDGFVMGEGSGALILEEYEHAKARGANILAEVVGGGMAGDAYHLTGTHPDGDGAIRGMKLAIQEAKITAAEIDYVNMHATSTPIGDISELKALKSVFGNRKSLSVSGTKSMTGHLLGAAGAIEGILSVKALMHQAVPPTINVENFEPEYEDLFDFPIGKGKERSIEYALSNTFGFGGHIATVLFKRFKE
jgi:3-oxoacyl-[acyl-carrier-protein] synthase II